MGDQFPNVDYCPNIRTPTLLIHGKIDKVVPFRHSLTLYNTLPPDSQTLPLFIDDMGHNNVQMAVREMFIAHINEYLDRHVRGRLLRQMMNNSHSHGSHSEKNKTTKLNVKAVKGTIGYARPHD
jgi:fermentation-respiration switch protein FrsA (DUF1100 family)